jgi:hypothetical protein
MADRFPYWTQTVALPLTVTTMFVAVTAEDSVALAANPARKSLAIYNRDTGLADVAFGAAAVGGQGIPLAAAAAAGGAGGSYIAGADAGVDPRAVHAICAAAESTHLVIVEGV